MTTCIVFRGIGATCIIFHHIDVIYNVFACTGVALLLYIVTQGISIYSQCNCT